MLLEGLEVKGAMSALRRLPSHTKAALMVTHTVWGVHHHKYSRLYPKPYSDY